MRLSAPPIRVLVVDDQEEDYLYLRYLLRKTNHAAYEVEWASSFEDGLKALDHCTHSVGLFDYRLGSRTGLDLLREAQSRGCEMPIILLTGHDSAEVDREASAAGAADYICKVDLDSVQLERAIRYSIRHAATLSALRKTQSQLEFFMRNVPCAVGIRDENGTMLFRNDRFSADFDTPTFAEASARVNGKGTWHYSAGDRTWLVNSFRMADVTGRNVQLFAGVDITDRVQAEEMLRRTTRVLNGILDSLPVVASSIDADGTILESRGRGLESLGLKDNELVGRNVFEAFPEIAADVQKALDGGLVNFLWPIERGGCTHYLDQFLRFDDARGSGAIGFSVDVTARVEAEAARNRRNQLLHSVMSNVPAIVGRLDAEGVVIEAEGIGFAGGRVAPGDLVGRVFADAFPTSREPVAQALTGRTVNFALSRSNDSADDWQAEFIVSFDREHGSGAIFFGRDVTERKRLERQLLSAIDLEQQRIGADLHDGLGQQLTGIACLAAALRDRLRRADSAVASDADAIARLVNEAIEHTRALARGLSPVQLEHTGLQSALEDLAYQVQRLHGVECRFRAEGPILPCRHDSAVHLYRITQEAITNAIRHGEARTITLALDTRDSVDRLTIIDDGVGFDPGAPRSQPGVGLGLMSYRAAMIGGTFSILSRPGEGTRVECAVARQP